MPASSPLSLYAICAPGLERLTAGELLALGLKADVVEAGGVAFSGGEGAVWKANLWLRTASRVVVRVAAFRATAFHELERSARKVTWERFLVPGAPVRFRVTCRKSRLYHSDAVAQRLVDAVRHRLGEAPATAAATDEEGEGEGEDAQLFVVRIFRDECTISADSSGALLHRRGYRQAVAKAPLRETIAAAMLLACEWRHDAPLLDPMCGSGTIPIEGALLARGIAPGLAAPGAGARTRDFAFTRWPHHDAAGWDGVVTKAEAARERRRASAIPPVQGSDRDAGGIVAAMANARRAGVADDLELSVRPLSAVEPPAGVGWLVSNPPYGVRVGAAEGESGRLRNLYASLGKVARQRCPGWTMGLLVGSGGLEQEVGVRVRELLRTGNGGIPVRLLAGRVAGAGVRTDAGGLVGGAGAAGAEGG